MSKSDISIPTPVSVALGGTGRDTLTDGSILVGNGAAAITMVGPLTDGQLLIGDTGADPVAAVPTSADGSITIAGGAGTLDFSIAAPVVETLGGTGQVTYSTGDILYSDGADSLDTLPIAQCPNILISSDDGIPRWTDDISYFYDDFLYADTNGAVIWPWENPTNGGTRGSSPSTATNIGIVKIGTAGNATGEASILRGTSTAGNASFVLGGGVLIYDAIINIPTLSTGAEEYVFTCGFGDVLFLFNNGEPGANACFFQYDRATSVNWKAGTRLGGAETVAAGGAAVAVDTNWTHLRIVTNADATSVEFFVDGVSLGTCAANIPTVPLTMGFKMRKTVGTTERIVNIDCVRFYLRFTNSRFSA